jgi:release factor glutamine methyltransferase
MTVSSSAVPSSAVTPPVSSPSSPVDGDPAPGGPAPAVVQRLRAAGCVFAEDEARLLTAAAKTPAELDAMVSQRATGLPLEHVVGWAEFCGMRIEVGPGVFVPRFRTEFLARQAAALGRPGAVVLDLCCGSGALGATVAAILGQIELHAADIDPGELVFARRNVAAAGGQVYEGDLFAPLPDGLRGRVDILIANVPYVPTREVALLPAEARVHEPRVALDGGRDGLDVLRRVAAAAPRWLAPGGHLLSEASERQAPMVAQTFALSGLVPWVARSEERDATAVIGTRPLAG